MRRAEQVGWVLNYLDDIESDLSAIHRIDNMWSMNGPRFFRFAYRLPAYQGAMRARAETQAMEEEKSGRRRDAVPVAAGELGRVEGFAPGVTQDTGDGNVWISMEKATD
jgi:hypothetical protein